MSGCKRCRLRMILMLVCILGWTGTIAQKGGHFQPCPGQWTNHDTSCYLLTSTDVTLTAASEACGQRRAHLLVIGDQQEQDFVQGFMDREVDMVWLGARYDLSLQKWVWSVDHSAPRVRRFFFGDRHSDNEKNDQNEVRFNRWAYGGGAPFGEQGYCSSVRKDGWWEYVNCSGTLPFVCEKPRACEVGWHGAKCDSRCHCLDADPCSRQDGACHRGCALGWAGASCNTVNKLPEASFHCFRTANDELRADITVDTKAKRYSVIQAVDQDGNALPHCNTFTSMKQREYEVYITFLLPAAFNKTDPTNSSSDTTEMFESSASPVSVEGGEEIISEVSTSSYEDYTGEALGETSDYVTASAPQDLTSERHVHQTSASGIVDNTSSGTPKEEDDESVSDGVASDDPVSVTAGYDEATDAAKRDVSVEDDVKNVPKEEEEGNCVASRSKNGSVTWLIEFREFPDVHTGNDVTVEVTCDLSEADSLEFEDSLVDNSNKAGPMEAAMLPVVTSVYLTDQSTGNTVQHFHLGQRLRLHVDVDGLHDRECAFPHSCVVKSSGDQQGQQVTILDHNGCGVETGPVQSLYAQTKGHFRSSVFPAFSLGFSALNIECQVHVEIVYSSRQCQKSCRRHGP